MVLLPLPGRFNPYPAKLTYFNFHPLEVVSRYRDPQLQLDENYAYLFNLMVLLICLSVELLEK